MVVEDKGPLCLAVIIATLAVSSVFIFARVLTRTLIRPQFGWDDGLIVVTWVRLSSRTTPPCVLLPAGMRSLTP